MRSPVVLILFLAASVRAQPAPPLTPSPLPNQPPGTIDLLDYFLQSADKNDAWTLNGTDVRSDEDPEDPARTAIILNKFSSPDHYEVYHVTPTDLRIRYEVNRDSPKTGRGNWIRRYEAIDTPDPSLGAVWAPRFVIPGRTPGAESHFRQDRLVFDDDRRAYLPDTANSVRDFPTFITVTRAANNFGRNNQTLADLSDCVRVISEWQQEGKVIEYYDYARAHGLVAWRWLERLSTLTPLEGDATGKLFHCENGLVYVANAGVDPFRPTVYKYDPKTKQRTDPLDTVRLTSHWSPTLGPQWYVIYRDTTKESPLTRKQERIPHTFALSECSTSQPIPTLMSLPHLYTTPDSSN